MPSDAWTLVREFALKAPLEITIAVLLGALRQDEARLEADQPASHAPGTWLPPAPAPPKRRGRPAGKRPRRARSTRGRNGSAAKPAPAEPKLANGNGRAKDTAALLEARKVGAALWRAAAALDNGRPWIPVARAFGLNEQVCLDAKRLYELPVGVSPAQAAEFCGASAPADS